MYHTLFLKLEIIAVNTNKTFFFNCFQGAVGQRVSPDNKLINKKISILTSEKCYAEQSSIYRT